MGGPHSVLPEILLRHTQVNGVLSNTGKEADKDLLCLFRAMVMNMKGQNDCNSHTSRFFTDFVPKSGHDPENFFVEFQLKHYLLSRKLCKETNSITISIFTHESMLGS